MKFLYSILKRNKHLLADLDEKTFSMLAVYSKQQINSKLHITNCSRLYIKGMEADDMANPH